MNFLHFLTMGQSFSGAKNASNPYRLAKQNWLPKFAPSPFAPASASPDRTGTNRPAPRTGSNPLLDPMPENVTLRPHSSPGSTAQGTKAARSGFPLFRSTTKPTLRLRQGELSLDTVTVVRNDLNETDWEIVPKRPAQSRTTRHLRPTPPPAPEPAASAKAGMNGFAKRLWQAGAELIRGTAK